MLLLTTLLTIIPLSEIQDSTGAFRTMEYELPAVTVSASIKHTGPFSEQPVAVSAFGSAFIETNRITETKDLSVLVPNFIQADYGSKMTSSIYVRGIGARMDQPSVGLYVDNIPILNKNNYDMDYYDLRQLYVLRGPQGTLYGRNTIGGVIDIHTFSPLDYQGTRAYAGYGNGNTSEVKVSTYHNTSDKFGFSIALNHRYSDGFFKNAFDGKSADRTLGEGARFKIAAKLGGRWTLENTAFANIVKQKGFAYSPYDEQSEYISAVNHNDPCSYDRFGFMDGLTFRREGRRFSFSSTTSYQHMDDDMLLDQDFTPLSMFTLNQKQTENAFTQEFVLRKVDESPWQWISGAFGFYRHLDSDSPVLFKRDGIDNLILANANNGIHQMFPDADLLILDDSFPIESDFKLPAYGMSLYHQSTYTVGRWKFTAGLRADYEHTSIKYGNSALINYRFTYTMPDYRPLPVDMNGRRSKSYFELIPRASVLYQFADGGIYANVSRGYKAGGYNTQIFSDILQGKMMSELMAELGVSFEGYDLAYDVSEAISYKPEYSWNYELGGNLEFIDGRLNLGAALFYIDLRDQQLTIFPPGRTTGRLMSNAGRSRSYGAELTANYKSGAFLFTGSYGYTNAKFEKYRTGNDDFSGYYVPYIPENTVSLTGEYKLTVSKSKTTYFLFNLGWQGMGRIYWNEANTVSQSFYGLLNGSVSFTLDGVTLGVWGKNLAEADYNTFYFKSMGNSFVQRGNPLRFGAYVNINF